MKKCKCDIIDIHVNIVIDRSVSGPYMWSRGQVFDSKRYMANCRTCGKSYWWYPATGRITKRKA